MFENKTREQIHSEILQDISNDYDKTVGSFIYDATKPPAIVLEKAYQDLNTVVDKLKIENLEGEDLALRINERTGISRKPATKAKGEVEVLGNGTITAGDIFETESGIQFVATETKTITTSGLVKVECTQAGIIGNVPANQIKLMPITILGINSVNNPQPTTDGFDAETDKSLLQRYYEKIQTPSTSGNKAHYKNWAKEIVGVGDAKVFPLWNGNNTVKVVIIDAEKKPASAELITTVQNYIDPNISGSGEGEAPIGAYCTVASATGLVVNVTFTAVKDSAYTDTEIMDNVTSSIVNYFKDIAFIESYVSYAIVGSLILNSPGILDYSNLTLNNTTTNISLNETEVPVLGSVIINV